jgi:hypothetical protein
MAIERVMDPPFCRLSTTEYRATARFAVVPWWAIATTTALAGRTPIRIEHANWLSGNEEFATSIVLASRPPMEAATQPWVADGAVVVVVTAVADATTTVRLDVA